MEVANTFLLMILLLLYVHGIFYVADPHNIRREELLWVIENKHKKS